MKNIITADQIMSAKVGQTLVKNTIRGEIVGISYRTTASNATGKARAVLSLKTEFGMARVQVDADVTAAIIR